MAAITVVQATSILVEAYKKYLPADSTYNARDSAGLKQVVSDLAAGGTAVESILDSFSVTLLYTAAVSNPSLFPGYPIDYTVVNADKIFYNSLPASSIVNFFYPEGSAQERAQMTSAIEQGQITKEKFMYGYVKIDPTTTNPSISDIIKSAASEGIPFSYPDSGLKIPGVTADQQDFVVAMYVGAFNRAPEHNGLKYWANKLTAELAWGTDQTTAYKVISKQMYIDGSGNNEGGTNLGNADYVNYAYNNILGRQGEAGGVNYWNNMLASGATDRGSFVATFVGDALGNAGDGDFLQARIAVSEFLAQEHVSGPNAPAVDLGLVARVFGQDSALSAIDAIMKQYGAAPASMKLTAFEAPHDVAAIELSGVAGIGSIDGVLG